MALIKCHECQKKISDQATACPYCGCPVSNFQNSDTIKSDDSNKPSSNNSSSKKQTVIIVAFISVLAILVFCVIFITRSKGKDADVPVTLVETVSNSTESFSTETVQETTLDIISMNVETSEVKTTTKAPKISMIYDSDIDETDSEYIITVSFYGDEYGIKPKSGYLSIEIVNDKKQKVYSNRATFNSSNYSKSAWGGLSCYGFKYVIQKQSITPGLTDDGTISVIASADGVEFAPFTQNAYHLPVKNVQIAIPSVPCSFSDYDYDNNIEATVRIDEIKKDQEFVGDHATLNLTFLSTTTYSSTQNTAKIVHVGYQLKNSSGVIVDSGTFWLESSFVGDRTETKASLYNLDLSEQYSLVLIDSIG